MAAEGPIPGQRPKLTFTLVHGTFGRNASWVEAEQHEPRWYQILRNWCHHDPETKTFRGQLRQEFGRDFDVEFEVVNWGKCPFWKRWKDNTLASRRAGACKLVCHLRHVNNLSSADRRYLVAHSHGGNVVMYALRGASVRNKVSGVICLSTPFLSYELAYFNRDLLFFSGVILLLLAVAKNNPALWAYFVIYSLIVITLLVANNFGEDLKSVRRIMAFRRRVRIPSRDQMSSASGEIPFLAIRPHGDEVAALFWFSRSAGAAFRALWQFVNTVGRWALYAFFAVRGAQFIAKFLPQVNLPYVDDAMSTVDQQALTPLMVLASAILIGMAIMRWSYAFDSLPWLARVDVRSKIFPWEGADAIAVGTFNLFKLRHTSVQNQSPPKIIKWIKDGHRVSENDRIARGPD